MLGYENYKGDESEIIQFQGIPGGMPGYTFTPQHMSMPGQHWGMMMNSHGGRLPPALPPPHHHPQHHLPVHHPPLHPFQPLPMPSSIDSSQPSGNCLDGMNVPSPTESDASSTGSSRSNRNRSSYNPAPVSPPPSRERFSYTRYQLELLNGIYTKIRYPNSMQKQLIAKRVGITRDQVKVWFQNRRRKDITGRKQTDVESNSPKMVPSSVVSGVLNELLSFENEPRGKKAVTAQKSYEKKVAVRRTRENSESSVDEVPQPKTKRQKVLTEDSCTGFPESYTAGVPEPYTGMPTVYGNQPNSFPTDSLPTVHFANEPSPGNSVGFDSFSSNSHSPFSSASHHDSDITPVNSANNSLVSTCQSNDSLMTNNAIELALRSNFRTISSEELDRPAPPNTIVPGIDASLLPRPRSLESPAAQPYIPVNMGTTDDGLHINPPNQIHTADFHTSTGNVESNSANVQLNQISLQVISTTSDIQGSSSNNELNLSTENELHLTTTSDGGLHVTKISSNKQNTASPSKTKEKHSRNEEVAPNVVAPPSEPLNFDPKIVSTQSLKPTPVPVSVAMAEAKAREFERLRSANNNNSIITSNSTDFLNITPLYTMNEAPNSGQPSIQNGIQVDPPMYLPNYQYSGHPGLYPDPITSSTITSPSLNLDKMMPYMMGCMPGFPAPPDPSFNGKHSNSNNNPAGIFKDVYPPSFLLPPYGIGGNNGVPYPTYEMPTDLSGGKKPYL